MTVRPNILFLLPDQLRPDFLGCYGADFLRTPAIDALAAHGTRYEAAISPSPICVPARGSMLTGQDAHETGLIHNRAWLRPDRREMGIESWAERLAEAGYQTSAIGKMHFYPWDISEGFQTRIIAEDKRHIHIRDDYSAALEAEGYSRQHGRESAGYVENKGASINPLPDHLQPDRWVASQAADHIRDMARDRPFAMMVGFPGPHCPYDPPAAALATIESGALPAAIPSTEESRTHHAEFVRAYKLPWADLDYSTLSNIHVRTIRHHYAALVERLDEDVATIIDALQTSGHLDNTVVVFASDHGDFLGDFGLVGKAYFHEPSIRVPLVVTDFRSSSPTTEANQVSLIDLYPTFMEWADLPVGSAATGRSLTSPLAERTIVGMTSFGTMVRTNRWKLVRYTKGTEALFDLENDPTEQHNVIALHDDRRAELDTAMMQSLVSGLRRGHADRYVAQAESPEGHPFHQCRWERRFPSPVGQDANSAWD